MSNYKIIFIVSSCINVDDSPLCYCPTRSVFSSEERLEQTVVTLQKIREKIPNVMIIVTNNNSLTEEQFNTLKEYSDEILVIESEMIKTHPNKSFAECCSLLIACQYIQEKKIEFDYVFKTSGRYYLMNEFDINKWPFNEHKIVSPQSGDGVVNNVIYSVSNKMFTYYMNRLQQCINLCSSIDKEETSKYSVEGKLFDYTNPEVHEFLNIPAYVAGMCSVQPRVPWSC